MSDRGRSTDGIEGEPPVDRVFPIGAGDGPGTAPDPEWEAELAAAASEPELPHETPVQRAKRIGGIPGAVLAGGMIAIRDLLEEPKDDRPVAIVEAPSELHDVDRDGVRVTVEGVDVAAPALPRTAAVVRALRKRRLRRLGRPG
jgi:hypothetical protein